MLYKSIFLCRGFTPANDAVNLSFYHSVLMIIYQGELTITSRDIGGNQKSYTSIFAVRPLMCVFMNF